MVMGTDGGVVAGRTDVEAGADDEVGIEGIDEVVTSVVTDDGMGTIWGDMSVAILMLVGGLVIVEVVL